MTKPLSSDRSGWSLAWRMLLEDGKPLRLGGRALDILITFLGLTGETISKEQLTAHT